MNVVDSSGWIEHFGDTPASASFGPAIEDIDNLLVPTIVIHEVVKWLLRRFPWREVRVAYDAMKQGTLIDFDDTLALEAARISLEHKLSTADSIIFASARAHGATLWTQDRHFEHLDGVRYIPG